MRIAIVSDIHGNRTALEAVLADLRQTSPDLILHGGDLADSGSSPATIVDQIRDLGWQGVMGNTDEMLIAPETLTEFASQSAPALQSVFAIVAEMATTTRETLGAERLDWLRTLPRKQLHSSITLVHASPGSLWQAPGPEARDDELQSAYGPLGARTAIYGHIHRPYIRIVGEMVVANTGSVSLSYDGDRRASYLLMDNTRPSIRRVEYDIDREVQALSKCALPHADWVARMLQRGCFEMP
jgi:putative phosphoesterase